jgi:hypothetical protein
VTRRLPSVRGTDPDVADPQIAPAPTTPVDRAPVDRAPVDRAPVDRSAAQPVVRRTPGRRDVSDRRAGTADSTAVEVGPDRPTREHESALPTDPATIGPATVEPGTRDAGTRDPGTAADVASAVRERPSVPIGPVDLPVNDIAARFMTELSQTIRRRPAPLPVSFQPMAEAITGKKARNVMLSTDNASRRALRRVGKVAATTDNVIHLAADPAPGDRVNEVIAHELTHIANPSPVARFFDDADDSPEERQAERVARVIAASPIAPTAATPSLLPGSKSPTAGNVIRRTAATNTTTTGDTMSGSNTAASSGGVSAGALAASITGRASAGEPTVQRWDKGVTPTKAPPTDGPKLGQHRKDGGGIGAQLRQSTDASEWFAEQLERNFDALVTALEDRMIVEFERRGGRLWEGL